MVDSIKRIVIDSKDICVEKDFYEDKSRDGGYIYRNRTENKFADMESELANIIEDLFEILNDDNCNNRLRHMYNTGEWEYLSVYLMFHLTLVLYQRLQEKWLME